MRDNPINITTVSLNIYVKDKNGDLPRNTLGTIIGPIPKRSGVPRTFKPFPISRRKISICSEFLKEIKLKE